MKEVHSVKLVTRLQDNGDGSYTTFCYNNEEEMLADHYQLEDLVGKKYKAMKKAILSGEDEDEYGYLGEEALTVIIEDGKITIEPFSIHSGQ